MSSQDQRVDISEDYFELSSYSVHVAQLNDWRNSYEGSEEQCLPGIHVGAVDGLVSLGVVSEWEQLEGPSFLSMAYQLCSWLCFKADVALDIFRRSSPTSVLQIPDRIELARSFDEVLAEPDPLSEALEFGSEIRRLQNLVARIATQSGASDGVDTGADRSLTLLRASDEMLKHTESLLRTQLLLNTVQSENGLVSPVIIDRLYTEVPHAIAALERIDLLYSEFAKETAENIHAIIDAWGFKHCYAQEQAARSVADPMLDSRETLKAGNDAIREALIEFNQAIFSKFFECAPSTEKTVDLSAREALRIRDSVVFLLGENLGVSRFYKIAEDVLEILEEIDANQAVVFNVQQGRFILSALLTYFEDLKASVPFDPTKSTSAKMAHVGDLIDRFQGVFGSALS